MEPLLLNVKDASKVIACSRATLYRLLSSEKLESVKNGGQRLIPAQSLRDFAASLSKQV
jgi:excisionase family DNA binding protein